MKQKKIRKMLRRNKLQFICISLLTGLLTGCAKFVSVPPPVTQLVNTNVFTNNTTATAAQTVIYAQMVNDPWAIENYTALSSDEFTTYALDPLSLAYYKNSLDATINFPGTWAEAYNYIYEANAVLEGLQNAAISPAVKKQLTGEAKFIRAFWYFYIANYYGDAPLVTGTDYKVNTNLARSPVDQVYQQIESDLLSAQSLLNNNFVDYTDTAITQERVRPTSWAATSLLARVYLYTGDYKDAETAATTVINNTAMFSLVTDLNQVFLANSSEAIWQITPDPDQQGSTAEGQFFILIAPPSGNASNSSVLSASLLNAFEAGDNRKSAWVGSFTDTTVIPSVSYLFPYKYKVYTGTTLTEYSMVLRLAEQYLIRAEARAQLGEPNAIEDLNSIRQRAGLNAYSGPTDKASMVNAIMHERQVELFLEGHRWLDLKRTKTVDVVMGTVTPQKGGVWNTNSQLYPIPESDIENAGNLKQNAGY